MFGQQKFYDYYRHKYEICCQANPKVLLEIGVRWGYSAFAFLSAAPKAHYCGIDMIGGGHGGVRVDTFERVTAMLERHFPEATVELVRSDTRLLTAIPGRRCYDFIHVDGSHRHSACRHDLELAWQAARPEAMIVVDDYDYIDGVRRAVNHFLLAHSGQISRHWHVRSLRGDYIIIKGGPK
jgi:predicted O-methyltransferase YrrM